MCRVDDADSSSVSRSAAQRARKIHRCDECSRDIGIGEIYRYVFLIYDGDPNSFHICSHCCIGQEWLVRECGGYILTETAEELKEHAEEYPSIGAPLLRLVDGMRRKWRDADLLPIPAVPEVTIAEVLAEGHAK